MVHKSLPQLTKNATRFHAILAQSWLIAPAIKKLSPDTGMSDEEAVVALIDKLACHHCCFSALSHSCLSSTAEQ